MSDLRTSLPVPTQPWEAARARFLEGLSEEEADRFKNATLENLFYDASAAQKRHVQKSRSWLMQERLSSLIDSAADYGKALDVYSNTYGLIICPIWGSLRVVLHIAREAGRFQEKVVEMLAQIGDVLPRFRIYQVLFKDHERLLIALSAAYLDVLRFCIRTKDFFKRAKQSMIPLSIVLKGAWKSFRTSFEESMSDFRKHSKIIEKEAKLAHMIESARRDEIELANRALQISNQKLAKKHRILSIVPSVEYQGKLARLSNQRHPGTTKWIHQTPKFASWSASTSSDCLCIYGIPGSGKSVLAASVVNSLQESTLQDAASLVCYYIFDYTDVASLEPLRLVGSLIQQVLQTLPLDVFDESFQCPFTEAQPWPTQSICIQFFFQLLKYFKTLWIVLDAIDELPLEAQTSVLSTIDQLLGVPSTTVKVFVTSRVENYLIRTTLKSHKSLKITQKEIDKDISLYINEQIKNTLLACNPLLENERLRQEIIDGLTTNAKGMFQWVKFQLYNLAEVLTENELKKVLKDLPKDLHETYSRIIERAENGPGGQAKLAMMQKLFRWVAVARRPLKLQELEETAGLEKTDTHLHTERTANNSGKRLISHCGNLLVHNEEDDTVTFAHHTIQQFLYSEPENLSNPASLSSIKCAIKFLSELDLASAHIAVGELCLAYLDFTDFETQIVQTPKGFNLKKEEAERLVWVGVPLAAPIKGLISWTQARLSSSKFQEDHEVTFTMPAAIRPSESLVQKYSMLDYISTFWVFHTAHLTPESHNWVKFKRITLDGTLSFEHRPWNDYEHRSRVQAVLSDLQNGTLGQNRRLRGTASRTDWLSNDMLMYSLAVQHGLGHLLELVDVNDLIPYLKLSGSYGLSMQSQFVTFIRMAIATDFVVEASHGFWGSSLIVLYSRYLLDTALETAYSAREREEALSFVTLEFSRWVNTSDLSAHSMLRQAVVLATELENVNICNFLLPHCIHTVVDFTSTLVHILRDGHLRRSIFDELVRVSVSGQCSPEVEWQLLFALQELFLRVKPLLFQKTFAVLCGSSVVKRSVLAVLLVSSRRPDLVAEFLSSPHGLTDSMATLDLPEPDWTSFSFGSLQFYDKVMAVNKTNLLQTAYSLTVVVAQFSAIRSYNLGLLDLKYFNFKETTKSILRLSFIFDVEAFEIDSYNFLEQAIFARADDLVKVLVPLYLTFVRDPRRKDNVRRIIAATRSIHVEALCFLIPLLPTPWLALRRLAKEGLGSRLLLNEREWRVYDWLLVTSPPSSAIEMEDFMQQMANALPLRSPKWGEILKEEFQEWSYHL